MRRPGQITCIVPSRPMCLRRGAELWSFLQCFAGTFVLVLVGLHREQLPWVLGASMSKRPFAQRLLFGNISLFTQFPCTAIMVMALAQVENICVVTPHVHEQAISQCSEKGSPSSTPDEFSRCMCICLRMCMCVRVCMYACTCVCVLCVCACMYVCMCVCMYLCTSCVYVMCVCHACKS